MIDLNGYTQNLLNAQCDTSKFGEPKYLIETLNNTRPSYSNTSSLIVTHLLFKEITRDQPSIDV